jgi:ferredoxin
MKVIITEACMGDRYCNNICPDVFEYNEDDLKSVVKFDEIPEQYKELVRKAARSCGADAIEVTEDDK